LSQRNRIIGNIPNAITIGNLIFGFFAILYAFHGKIELAAYLIFCASIFDFLDGFLARKLNSQSQFGKELDSLADNVSFGVAPAAIIYNLLKNSFSAEQNLVSLLGENFIAYIILILTVSVPVFSAIRLAKFNTDNRQNESFFGLPTPATAIFIASLPIVFAYSENSGIVEVLQNVYFITGMVVFLCVAMVSEIRLFSLKFKDFSWGENKIRYIFLALSLVIIVILKFVALPLLIVLYICISIVSNSLSKK